MELRSNVTLFVDGNHSISDGQWTGGWGYVLRTHHNGRTHNKEAYGFETKGTNYGMKLTAIVEGIKALKTPCKVLVMVNDAAILNVAHDMRNIIARNGKLRGGKKLAYPELWSAIIDAASEGHHELIFHKSDVSNVIKARVDTKVIMKS